MSLMASERRNRMARQQLADMAGLDRLSSRPIARIASAIGLAALKRYRRGLDPRPAIRDRKDELIELVRDLMVAAHLTGRKRVAAFIRDTDAVMASVYDETIQFLKARLQVTGGELNQLRRLYSPQALHVVTQALDFQERRVQAAILDVTREGLHKQAGIARVRAAMQGAGLSPKPHVYETVFRTQTSLAYAAGEANVLEDPDITEIVVAYEYQTAGDDRVRPDHEPLEGFVAEKDDPIWDTMTPPLGWNCRCVRVPIFTGDDYKLKAPPKTAVVDGKEVTPGPDPGWDFNPAELFRDTIKAGAV